MDLSTPSRLGALALVAGLSGGCTILDAKVENLRQLHEPDGSVRRVAVVQSDSEYLMNQLLLAFRFQSGDGEALGPQPEAVKDPFGTSLENVLALATADTDDERVLGLQAELLGWLAVDCEYALSRERAVLGLGRVGRALGIEDPSRPLEERQATRPGQAVVWLRDLREAVEPYLGGIVAAPSPQAVSEAVGAIDVTVLDRDGARRMLRALNIWYDGERFETPPVASLGELRRELARRTVELALAESLSDPDARVRAAALETCVRMSGNRLPRLLRAGMTEADSEVVQRTLALMAELGVPEEIEPEFEGDAAAYRNAWIDLIVRLLRVVPEGPVSIAGCRALGRISGAGFEDLRPEAWSAWWDAQAARENAG